MLKTTLYPFQRDGVDFAKAHPYSLNLCEMGCLSGDSILRINRAGVCRKINLKTLYKKFHGCSWNKEIPTKIRSWNGERFCLNTLKDVLLQGKKETWLLSLSGNGNVRLTKDHEVLTKRGWIRAENLTAQDEIACDNLHFGHGQATWESVISLDTPEIESTYDLVCEDPHRNFVADSICVHNCGKSIQAIALADETRAKTLIICPAFLKQNWINEIKLHSTLQPARFGEDDCEGKDVIILNYERVKKFYSLLLKEKFDFVVADEVHFLKSPDAIRTKTIHDFILESKPKRFMGLTGTIYKNRICEIYSPLKLCDYVYPEDKKILKDFDYWKFCNTFSNPQVIKFGNKRFTKFVGIRNAENLRQMVRQRVFRRTAEGNIELPPITHKKVWLDVVDEAMGKELLDTYKAFNLRQSILTDGITRTKVKSALQKCEFTTKYIQEMITQGIENILVFSDHIMPTIEISKGLEGVSNRIVSGQMSPPQREKTYQDFQDGKFQVLIATIGSSSVGINLTKANHVIYNDLSWIPGDLMQSLKRVHRIKQKKPCFVHYILAGQFDEYILNTINGKIATIDTAMKGV